jgi:AraC family transcriptional regulator
MDSQAGEVSGVETIDAAHAGTWIRSVIGLLDVASRQLEHSRDAAQSAIEQATSLLQERMRPRSQVGTRASGGLLAWQARKVRDYVDAHLAGRVLVSDLSTILQLSEAHFSRSFKRTFGLSPHVFVLRRRLELAARLMLETSASLTDIALRCGFTDQAHLCNQFRESMGETPAAWRRARREHLMSA